MKILYSLLLFLGLGSASAVSSNAFTDKQVREIERLIKKVLIEDPGIVAQSFQKFVKQQKEQKKQRSLQFIKDNNSMIVNDPTTPILGNKNGDVTVVEFVDYNCGICRREHSVIQKLLKEDPKVRVAVKIFPVLGKDSVLAASYVLAAKRQGKFAEIHNALLESKEPVSKEVLLKVAKGLGLDLKKLEADANDQTMLQNSLQPTIFLAQSLGIRGTPTFIIGENFVEGQIEYNKLKFFISESRQKNAK